VIERLRSMISKLMISFTI